jgi:hypothetical protein
VTSALPDVSRRTARAAGAVVVLFGAWNVLMWGARVRNIVIDPDLDATARLLWSVPAVFFAVGGATALLHRFVGGAVVRRVVLVTAAGTVLYWPVRTVLLLGNGRSRGFVVVHLVLAVVSVGLGVGVLRRLRPPR